MLLRIQLEQVPVLAGSIQYVVYCCKTDLTTSLSVVQTNERCVNIILVTAEPITAYFREAADLLKVVKNCSCPFVSDTC